MKISIVIPVYNESDNIENLVRYLKNCNGNTEIIIADGQSTDETVELVKKNGAVTFLCPKKGRAAQMNYGAGYATGDILYFLHADSYPPQNFYSIIVTTVKAGIYSGCFKLSFDCAHWFLKLNCWFTRFNIDSFRFGDQSLFVTKDVFVKCGGYNEKLIVMEDNEIITRIKKYTRLKVINKPITTSARKYHENGIFKLQFIYGYLYFLYRIGYSQENLLKTYKRMINQDKI